MSLTLAYLAGAMDSDGCFSIKKSTYHMRVRKDASNPVFSERVSLKQVTPQIPELLAKNFGGTVKLRTAQTDNGKPLHVWVVTDRIAAKASADLLPFLLVKKRQAKLIIELRESKKPGYGQVSYWFALEFPNWKTMELVTTVDAARMLGHKHSGSTSQAVQNGSILAIPYNRGKVIVPRIPRLLIERLASLAGTDGRSRKLPTELVTWRERLWQEVRELNKIGIHGTPVYHRTGPFKMT